VILVVTLAVRWRLRDFPLERDEGEYAYNAQRILEGEPPYHSSYASQKYPGAYFASAAALAVWPQLPAGLHLGLAVANAGSIVLLFLLMRRLAGDRAGVAAAGAYALLSIGVGVLGFAAHATHFVVLPMLGGLLLIVQAIEREKALVRIACAGALFGLSIIARQPAVVFAAFGGAMLVAMDWHARRPWLTRAAFFGLGVAAPLLLLFSYLWMSGVFPKFWFWTFTYAAEYGSQYTLAQGWGEFTSIFPRVVGANLPLWLIALAGLAVLVWMRDWRTVFVTGWLISAVLAVSAGLYFRGHYFVQLLPVAAALVGIAAAGPPLREEKAIWWRRIVGTLVPVSLAFCVWRQADYLFFSPPVELCRKIYGGNLFPESESLAHELRARSQPGDKLAVLGSEAQIYPLAGMHSATGYLYTYALMEESPFAERFQREMMSEIESARPRFIVVVNSPVSWLIRPRSPVLILNWINPYLTKNYQVIGVVALGNRSFWGIPTPPEVLDDPHFIVYQRKND
jgi:hypothetical protein